MSNNNGRETTKAMPSMERAADATLELSSVKDPAVREILMNSRQGLAVSREHLIQSHRLADAATEFVNRWIDAMKAAGISVCGQSCECEQLREQRKEMAKSNQALWDKQEIAREILYGSVPPSDYDLIDLARAAKRRIDELSQANIELMNQRAMRG